jgi:hypothetical protein
MIKKFYLCLAINRIFGIEFANKNDFANIFYGEKKSLGCRHNFTTILI